MVSLGRLNPTCSCKRSPSLPGFQRGNRWRSTARDPTRELQPGCVIFTFLDNNSATEINHLLPSFFFQLVPQEAELNN